MGIKPGKPPAVIDNLFEISAGNVNIGNVVRPPLVVLLYMGFKGRIVAVTLISFIFSR